MSYVQLIERVELPEHVWLTFWELDKKSRLSLEIKHPEVPYRIGDLFRLNRNEQMEAFALEPLTKADIPGHLVPLIAVPTGSASVRRETIEVISVVETAMHSRPQRFIEG